MGGSFVLRDLIEMRLLAEALENSAQKAIGDCFLKHVLKDHLPASSQLMFKQSWCAHKHVLLETNWIVPPRWNIVCKYKLACSNPWCWTPRGGFFPFAQHRSGWEGTRKFLSSQACLATPYRLSPPASS